jgi:hypothetical protein
MNKDTENNRAQQQAASQLDSIREMVAALNSPDEDAREDAMTSIQEDPLSVEVRSDWASTPSELKAGEFQILLCTGGPAVRILGQLDCFGDPESATLEYQDWFTSWERLPITNDDERVLLDYSRCFYFGE